MSFVSRCVALLLPFVLMAADDGGLGGSSSGGGGGGQPAGQGDASGMSMLFMLPLVFGLMYFIVIRPQRREEKKRKELMNSLKKGDEVVTIGGLHGEVVSVGETTVDLKVGINDDTVLRFNKGAISSTPAVAATKAN